MNKATESTKKLLAKDLKEAEHARLHKFVHAPEGHTFEEIKKPAYWGNVSAQLSPWTRIDVRAYDGTWYAELLVTSVGRQWARVDVLLHKNLTSADIEQTETGTHDVRFDATDGWCVIRRADREKIHVGEESREQAEGWLASHLKQTAEA